MADRAAVSGSVAAAIRRLDGEVPAAAIVWELLNLHPEYGGGRAGSIRLAEAPDAVRKPPDEWMRDVRALFDGKKVPQLHGRIVILGLAILEPAVRLELDRAGAYAAISGELDEPLQDLVGTEVTGVRVAEGEERRRRPKPPEPLLAEAVPTHTDNPATTDALKRVGFARMLAQRIRDMRAQEIAAGDRQFPRGRSFLVHLHGPWGSGKTSLLNFIEDDLHDPSEGEKPWVVVRFNAWQHQRIVPPWWWLMETLYRDALRELWQVDKRRWMYVRAREWAWRARGGWPGLLMVAFGVAALILTFKLGWWDDIRDPWRNKSGELNWKWVGALVGGVAAAVSSVVTVVGAIRGAGRWAFTTSARAAKAYIETARDPMATAQEHFAKLVDWIDYSVVLFVDDLDRCLPDYVVELLEGVQTLFRDVPVAYVVAADREWVADSYNTKYGTFASAIGEPGRPLGYLFLEKTFQMTATVPAIPPDVRLGLWEQLIGASGGTIDADRLKQARKAAQAEFADAASDAEVQERLQARAATSAEEHQARTEAAAVRLASAAVAEKSEHALRPFSLLLDYNPRSMKRLVNAYGVARGVAVLYGAGGDASRKAQHRTALWTILNLRWPRLGEFLAERPERVELILEDRDGKLPDDVPADVAPLFRDERVAAVVRGDAEGVDAELDAAAIREALGFR